VGEVLRDRLPDAVSYFCDRRGLSLTGKGKWRTTKCEFHDGSDSMRVHIDRGGFICMNCGAKGGDILAYEMAINGTGFVDAAKALGAYQDDGKPHQGSVKPTPIPARTLLELVAGELTLASVLVSDLAKGRTISPDDHVRLLKAAGRIAYVAGVANAR